MGCGATKPVDREFERVQKRVRQSSKGRLPLRLPAERLAVAEAATIPEESVVEGDKATPADQQYESAKRFFLAEKFEEAKVEFSMVEGLLDPDKGETAQNFRNLDWYINQVGHRLKREEGLLQAQRDRRSKSRAEGEASKARAGLVVSKDCKNSPGQWTFFISYTQKNDKAARLATELYHQLKQRSITAWLDVQMEDKSEAAMQEGIENSTAVLAIVSDGAGVAGNAYFERPFCLKELRWAKANGTHIQPVVLDEDKKRITELLDGNPETGLPGAPDDLRDLGSVDFVDVIQSDMRLLNTCLDIILDKCRKADVPV